MRRCGKTCRLCQNAALFQQADNPLHARLDRQLMRWQYQVRLGRWVIGGSNAGEEGDLAPVGLGIMANDVSLAADFEWGGEVYDQEPLAADDVGGLLTDRFVGGDKRTDAENAGVVEEPGDLRTAAKVFAPLVRRETEVLADAAAHILAI